MLENLDLGTIITIVFGLLTTFVGGFWLKVKGKFSEVVKLGSELLEFMQILQTALDDDKLTKEEIARLKKEGGDISIAWKKLISRE